MKYLLAALLLTITLNTHAKQYDYIAFKVGSFIDRCEVCLEPDGSMPSYISFGRSYIYTRWDITIELLHRSNFDLGAPFESKNTFEYARNGAFAEIKYKFNIK